MTQETIKKATDILNRIETLSKKVKSLENADSCRIYNENSDQIISVGITHEAGKRFLQSIISEYQAKIMELKFELSKL